MADAHGLGPCGAYTSCRFDSCPWHMDSRFETFAFFLAGLMFIAIVAKALSLAVTTAENGSHSPVQNAYTDTDGNLKYAVGGCETDAECQPTGCSMEICGSEEVVSTCEIKADRADPGSYKCGCYQSSCAWKLKQ